ncbi:acylphosphatase [Agrococcus sp. SGAir0287]|uniref:acylphosphatase n=1 Tax=Agrococcus sp. SGAir0287 TaxID=2070347 RepID=UPI0010CD6557|nr:acylphosphatase [Agrococcus sp. SGAir0287]QCR18808.1 acylphosphatase [Agrococcus sp. SGAir0287]
MTTAVVATVHGMVQGVGFRWAARAEAERLGVAGSARNLVDGTVEVVAEGEPAAVDAMLAWLRQGPPSATVTQVDVAERSPRDASGFAIR